MVAMTIIFLGKDAQGGIRQLDEVSDTCVEFVIIWSPLSQHPKMQKGASWRLSWCLPEPEKSTKSPFTYAWLAVKPNNTLSSVGNSVGKKEGQLPEPLTSHWFPGIFE